MLLLIFGFYAATIIKCQPICNIGNWDLVKMIFDIGKSKPRTVSFNFAGAELVGVLKILLREKYQGDIHKDITACKNMECVLLLRRIRIRDSESLTVDAIYRRAKKS